MPQKYLGELKVNVKQNLQEGMDAKEADRKKRNKYQRLWASKNRVKIDKYTKNWRKNHPWFQHYKSARARVKYPSHHYYKEHLEFAMNPNDFKFLWLRDKAYLMGKPSIDRIDDKKGYILSNCRFVELSFNMAKRWGWIRGEGRWNKKYHG